MERYSNRQGAGAQMHWGEGWILFFHPCPGSKVYVISDKPGAPRKHFLSYHTPPSIAWPATCSGRDWAWLVWGLISCAPRQPVIMCYL